MFLLTRDCLKAGDSIEYSDCAFFRVATKYIILNCTLVLAAIEGAAGRKDS